MPKRYGNLYPKICNIHNIHEAYTHAKRGKGWYKEVQEIEKDVSKYLYSLQNMLTSKTYKTSQYKVFTKVDKGKERILYKLPFFPDRVCQWAIIQVIEPILINKLIYNTFSAIPERGIHLALKRLDRDIRNDKEGTKYCLKLDVRKYYPSINHTILKGMYKGIFKDKDLLWLLDEIIDSTDAREGIPIGNYLSQWSGNMYLSGLDHWVKRDKKVRYYYRYMDDMVILHHSKQFLHNLRHDIEQYLLTLKLTLKDNWQVFPSRIRGIDFVGYRHFGSHVLLRKSTTKNFKRKMRKIFNNSNSMTYKYWCRINSYSGWLKWCNSYNLRSKYLVPLLPKAEKYYREVIKGEQKSTRDYAKCA